jgi:hypothetical protein
MELAGSVKKGQFSTEPTKNSLGGPVQPDLPQNWLDWPVQMI